MNKITKDHDLMEILLSGDNDDLGVLADYITDSGNGRLTVSKKVCIQLVNARGTGMFNNDARKVISDELSKFGGNSIATFFRGRGVSYAEIVRDVADHINASYKEEDTTATIEQSILAVFAEKAVNEMSAKEKAQWIKDINFSSGSGPLTLAALLSAIRVGGFQSYQIALLVANAAARTLLGRGLTLAANAALTRGMSVILGPVGLVITGVWTLYDLASPAYRVTVPCVIQIAYMRQRKIYSIPATPS
jgi:uncharacterized protein YaaW (UPF0174 family)